MGDGTKENPYTREDVIKLIERNGGIANGLNLSGKVFVEPIDLSDLDLSGIDLSKTRLFLANFNGSNLDRAVMLGAKLQHATFNPLESKAVSLQTTVFRDADLTNAEFREANLTAASFQGQPSQSILPAYLQNTDFRGANLFLANFEGCYFYGTKLEGAYIRGNDITEAHLEQADWGNYKIGEEGKKEELHFAESIYRQLKQWYTNAGMYGTAARFYYREKEAARKGVKHWNDRYALQFFRFLFGYGERWWNTVGWIIGLILLFASAYWYINFTRILGTLTPNGFLESLYFSAISFIMLGYGEWAPTPTGLIKFLGVVEAFVGFFMMTLLLVTFVRKWTR